MNQNFDEYLFYLFGKKPDVQVSFNSSNNWNRWALIGTYASMDDAEVALEAAKAAEYYEDFRIEHKPPGFSLDAPLN